MVGVFQRLLIDNLRVCSLRAVSAAVKVGAVDSVIVADSAIG